MKSPFCKVCFDTGKPESLYNSHYVNDVPGKKGVVVCPTLLSLECRYCKKTGHTVSRCPAITNTRKLEFARQRQERQATFRTEKQMTATPAVTIQNRFAALEHDDSFRAPPPPPIRTITSYATVLAATSSPQPATVCVFQTRSPSTSPPPQPAVVLRVFQPRSPSTSPPPLLSWTDSMDSDSDDGSLCDEDEA